MSDLQHPDARSFESVADLYERARPPYPEAAIAWLVERLRIRRGSTVLDLGAGTGKLARALVPLAARVIAVEPGPEMLARLVRAVPAAEPVLGAAEAIPLADDAVDAVICGQSFHWFRHDEALPEIRRVLRPGGGLGLIWNLRDPDDEFQNEVSALLERFAPAPAMRVAVADLIEQEIGGEVTSHVFSFEQALDQDAVVERVGSISFVAAAPDADRRGLEAGLRALVAARGGSVAFRYVTEAYVTFAV